MKTNNKKLTKSSLRNIIREAINEITPLGKKRQMAHDWNELDKEDKEAHDKIDFVTLTGEEMLDKLPWFNLNANDGKTNEKIRKLMFNRSHLGKMARNKKYFCPGSRDEIGSTRLPGEKEKEELERVLKRADKKPLIKHIDEKINQSLNRLLNEDLNEISPRLVHDAREASYDATAPLNAVDSRELTDGERFSSNDVVTGLRKIEKFLKECGHIGHSDAQLEPAMEAFETLKNYIVRKVQQFERFDDAYDEVKDDYENEY